MRALLPVILALAIGQLRAQDTVHTVVAESTARRIVLDRIHGSTVRTEKLEQRDGRPTYTYDVAVLGHPGDVTVHVDATDGRVLDIIQLHGPGDSAAMADVRKESTLKDTAAMPPNTLKDTTAGRTRDSTPSHTPAPPPPH
jgi:hypothetical protein